MATPPLHKYLYKEGIMYWHYPPRLFIEKLPKHPEYPKAPATDKSRIKKLLKQAMPRAMELKEKLRERYDKEKEELEQTLKAEVSQAAPFHQEGWKGGPYNTLAVSSSSK